MSSLENLSARLGQLETRVAELTEVIDEILAKNIPIQALLHEPADAWNPAASTLKLVFDEKCVVRNSYPADTWHGETFKWLGPDRSTTVPIHVERSVPYLLTIKAPFVARTVDAATDCKISIDGQSVPADIKAEGLGVIITVQVPAATQEIVFPIFLLTIEFGHSAVLSEGSDHRKATIAVSEITVTPSASAHS